MLRKGRIAARVNNLNLFHYREFCCGASKIRNTKCIILFFYFIVECVKRVHDAAQLSLLPRSITHMVLKNILIKWKFPIVFGPGNYYAALWVWLFNMPHLGRIILSFCDWLFSFALHSKSSSMLWPCVQVPFLLNAEYLSLVCVKIVYQHGSTYVKL